MDAIFKALADDTRRLILDVLRKRDGLTLGELEDALADAGVEMTRFGVMKHLKVLESASLVLSRKQGRFKYHHLNVVPLQEVIDRWIEPLTQKPLARATLDLKIKLEGKVK
ncbi:MAG: metalloregulator ArsR/SmtB family transcription factor [Rhizobiaceae bacterium]